MRRVVLVSLFCFVIAMAIASPAQTISTIYSFCALNNCPDGSGPAAPVTQGSDGSFYGTTSYGGAVGWGTVFRITPQGALTTLHSFCSEDYCADGMYAFTGVVQATDGNFYGTTYDGGDSGGDGTVYKITPEGVLTTLHSFQFQEGYRPDASLIQGIDGDLYGTTSFGGANFQGGAIFKITLDGDLTVVYSFCSQRGCTDGSVPESALIQANDGNFYGTTGGGGVNCAGSGGCGTVFKITPQGALTTLYSFCAQIGCGDGSNPYSALVQGSDGNFYGTTYGGGASGHGTVFKLTPLGMLTTLHTFSGPDGSAPAAGLVQGVDGNFYGTTTAGGAPCELGAGGCGTIFRVTPNGTFTTLYSFSGPDGTLPQAGLAKATDQSLYGTTANGGTNCGDIGCGTLFHLIVYAALSVSKSGLGTVSGGEGKIYCGDLCSYTYDLGTQITLSSLPFPGYTFVAWTGCDKVNGSYCSVTMTGAENVTATFTAANVTLSSLTFKPSYVKGGQLSAGTLTLSAAAPPGGVTVALSSDHPAAAHPPSFVFVPGGKSTMQFAVQTFPVKRNTTVSLTATAGGSQVSGTLMVGTTSLPPSLK